MATGSVPTNVLTSIEAYGKTQGMSLLYSFAKLLDQDISVLDGLLRAGNTKIPNTTAIFNMSSATDCPSRLRGICKAVIDGKNICYAKKSEREYRPNVLPFRRRQTGYWLTITPEKFVSHFLIINATKRDKFDKIRLNEAGDFHSQACVDKAEKIARLLKKFDITVYCYTSRHDLEFKNVRTLVVNGSNFQKAGVINEFKMVPKGEKPPKGYKECPMNCKKCDRCSKRGSKTWVPQH